MASSHYIADSAPPISFPLPFFRGSAVPGEGFILRFAASNPAVGIPLAVTIAG
ncbi:hypothetical protein [Bradyrhizobium sp. 192]|uniref:hypothetical protein n=1 Tax=Bradyrhizobium sp. 192 TaxID=2782660 RepID=UPI001FFF9F6B|nr:hypothetical protein [Bradyrhizobium sp. 192]UPJ60297.1 hypothetical protein IVB24_12060 [Bradyrhizobium sp. 192]